MRKKILPKINSNKYIIPNLKEFNYESDDENNNNFRFTSSIFIINKNELNKNKKISNFHFLSDKNNNFIFDDYIQNQVTERKKNVNKKIKLKSISTNFDLNKFDFKNNNNDKFRNLEKNLSNNLITSNNNIIKTENNRNKSISRNNNNNNKNKFKLIYTTNNNKIPTLMNNNKNNNINKNANKLSNNLSLNKIIKKERVLNIKFSEKYGIKLYF